MYARYWKLWAKFENGETPFQKKNQASLWMSGAVPAEPKLLLSHITMLFRWIHCNRQEREQNKWIKETLSITSKYWLVPFWVREVQKQKGLKTDRGNRVKKRNLIINVVVINKLRRISKINLLVSKWGIANGNNTAVLSIRDFILSVR